MQRFLPSPVFNFIKSRKAEKLALTVLACFLLLLATVLLRGLTPSFQVGATWQQPVEQYEKFTVVINTFKHPARLHRAIHHYESCHNIAEIRIVWAEQTTPPNEQTNPEFFDGHIPEGQV